MTPPRAAALARALLLAFACLLAAGTARAGGVVPDSFTCPVDGTRVEVRRVASSNLLGGIDSDFCPYSTGTQARELEIATCPGCGYSARVGHFETRLDDKVRAAIRAAVAPALARLGEPARLAPWERYDLAVAVARARGETAWNLAQLHLEAAWTVRDRVVGFIPKVTGPQQIATTLDELEPQADALSDPERWAQARFDLHRVAHRGGFVPRRERYLHDIETRGGLPGWALDRLRRVKEWIGIEDRYLGLALESLEAWLAKPGGDPGRRSRADYLVGDLLRRLGREAEGLPHVQAQARNALAPEDVRAVAQQVVEAVGK